MCGRYSITQKIEVLQDRFDIGPAGIAVPPRYNIAPGQSAPVVLMQDGRRVLTTMQWGLVPSWAKDASIGNKMINARGESVDEKPSFKKAFAQRRCLVIADGFYEWRKEPGRRQKVPMCIQLKNHEPFAMAGLWERWQTPDGDDLTTYTIITTSANELLADLHLRMPVILSPDDETLWLESGTDAERLKQLLKPYPGERMAFYPISNYINSPANEGPQCIEPVRAAQTGLF